jgi:hypothetical protein
VRRRLPLLPKARKRKRRVVVDTSVLVAGVSAFKETYVPGRTPSADLLHEWAKERGFANDFVFVPT